MKQQTPVGKVPGHRESRKPTKGRVLRVKYGYNPNSSSMGSMVFALPAALMGLTVAFGAVAGLIFSALVRKGRQDDTPSKDGTAGQEDS